MLRRIHSSSLKLLSYPWFRVQTIDVCGGWWLALWFRGTVLSVNCQLCGIVHGVAKKSFNNEPDRSFESRWTSVVRSLLKEGIFFCRSQPLSLNTKWNESRTAESIFMKFDIGNFTKIRQHSPVWHFTWAFYARIWTITCENFERRIFCKE